MFVDMMIAGSPNQMRPVPDGPPEWNTVSHQAHGALGYQEAARLILFQKDLDQPSKGEAAPNRPDSR
jgi:hypothetical protein